MSVRITVLLEDRDDLASDRARLQQLDGDTAIERVAD